MTVDVADKSNPKPIVHRNWSPPFGGGTHNCLPLPDRDLLIVLDEAVLDGMETLLRGWCCEVIKAPDLGLAIESISKRHLMPNGLLVDYHLDQGNGIEAIVQLRRRYGDLPAILITADRSPAVREQARAQGVQVLHKPIKPAALRALLAQWRMMLATAAAE